VPLAVLLFTSMKPLEVNTWSGGWWAYHASTLAERTRIVPSAPFPEPVKRRSGCSPADVDTCRLGAGEGPATGALCGGRAVAALRRAPEAPTPTFLELGAELVVARPTVLEDAVLPPQPVVRLMASRTMRSAPPGRENLWQDELIGDPSCSELI
jgi:hypothetical protein